MVEMVLLYSTETWMMTKMLTKKIDGIYTRMLWMALNISWKRHMTNEELYRDLPRVSSKSDIRRMKLAGHARCHQELLLNKLILWNLLHGQAQRGSPCQTFLHCLKEDTNLHSLEEIDAIMKQ